jgi:hypothetical protein
MRKHATRALLALVAGLTVFGASQQAVSASLIPPSTQPGPAANCYLTAHNPDANIWVHVSGPGNVTIRGHGHLHCQTHPREIHAKGHFQKFVFPPPNEPDHNGYWKEIAATQVYSGLNEHNTIIVPDHHVRWRSGRWRFAFEFWGYSRPGNHYGKGYYCSSDLNIPKSPPAKVLRELVRSVTIHPDTHRCYPPPV